MDVAGYLRRLGLDHPGPPSVAGLAALHRAHVERIPYDSLDVYQGRPTIVDPTASAERVVSTGRTGYCLHLNAAFSALLRALGFDVRWHRGWVWSDDESDVARPDCLNHLALTVHELPGPGCPSGAWLVDVGLGDALHEPMSLREGEAVQGPFRYAIVGSGGISGGWGFRHDPAGSFVGMDLEPRLAVASDFTDAHVSLSTSPDSSFVQYLSVQRRDATGVDKIIGATLRRIEGPVVREQELTSSASWYGALADVFGLALDYLDPSERQWLWQRVRADQDAWKRREQETVR